METSTLRCPHHDGMTYSLLSRNTKSLYCRLGIFTVCVRTYTEHTASSSFVRNLWTFLRASCRPSVHHITFLFSFSMSHVQYTFTYLSQHLSEIYGLLSTQGVAALTVEGGGEMCSVVNTTLKMLCSFAALATPAEMSGDSSDFVSLLPVMLSIGPLQVSPSSVC